ncbi:hypothetical protein K1719_038825 [Acacia pycnantha]|nr:hypothetical protein K1719_038825 [Acacia pycnantha]
MPISLFSVNICLTVATAAVLFSAIPFIHALGPAPLFVVFALLGPVSSNSTIFEYLKMGKNRICAPDKKQQSFIQNSLVSLAGSRGIDLVRVDVDRPLVDQGPFDCVLHKLYGEDWKPQLRDFEWKYPNACEADEDKQMETFIFQTRAPFCDDWF